VLANPLDYLLIVVATALTAAVTILLARKAAPTLGLLDRPSRRKLHRGTVPVVGGLGVFLGLAAGSTVVLLTLQDAFPAVERSFVCLAGAATLLLVAGILDDRLDLTPHVKLAVQTVAALVAVAGGVVLREVSLPGWGTLELGWFAYPLTLFWLLGMVNAVNMIDGLDGLAAGILGLLAAALFGVGVSNGNMILVLPSLLVLGSLVGFLPFNLSRAKAFLGDGGSMLLGFLLGGAAVLGSLSQGDSEPMIVCLAFMAVPILDVATTILRRARARRSIFRPDVGHVHHRLQLLGFTPGMTVLVILGATLFSGSLGVALVSGAPVPALLVAALAGGFILREVRRQLSRKRESGDATEVAEVALYLLAARTTPSLAEPQPRVLRGPTPLVVQESEAGVEALERTAARAAS
jgi:UDP-GlcNAc:undecaprenyl-phosphate GlcNAc-1-phosphate transferase